MNGLRTDTVRPLYELDPIEPRQPMAGAKAGYCATAGHRIE